METFTLSSQVVQPTICRAKRGSKLCSYRESVSGLQFRVVERTSSACYMNTKRVLRLEARARSGGDVSTSDADDGGGTVYRYEQKNESRRTYQIYPTQPTSAQTEQTRSSSESEQYSTGGSDEPVDFPYPPLRSDSGLKFREFPNPGKGGSYRALLVGRTPTPVYEVTRVDQDGSTRRQTFVRRKLLYDTGLAPRDLRRIDPSLLLTTSSPTIVVKDHALLLHVGSIRCIAFATHAILFDHTSAAAARFVSNLKARLAACAAAAALGEQEYGWESGDGLVGGESHGRYHWEKEDIQSNNNTPSLGAEEGPEADMQLSTMNSVVPAAPFALEVVEAALLEATTQLERQLVNIQPRVDHLQRILPDNITSQALSRLRHQKQLLVDLDTRAGAVRSMLLDLLDDEEEVKGMTISDQDMISDEEREKQEEEVESLLEYYLQRAEAVHGEAERLLENMRDLEESIALSISSRRFEVSKLELVLSIVSFAVTVGALVTGVFGMNLKSYIEEHAFAFFYSVGGIILGMLLITFVLFWYTRLRRIL